jgi:hypothetical protein
MRLRLSLYLIVESLLAIQPQRSINLTGGQVSSHT